MESLGNQETLEQKVARLEQENALLREENLRLKEEAYKDSLTGIMNRRSFDKTVSLMFSPKTPEGLEEKRQKEGRENNVCFIMIDIDRFKYVNDTYGHPAGDEVLREVAKRLENSIRKTDVIGRYIETDPVSGYGRTDVIARDGEADEGVRHVEANVMARYGGEEIVVILREASPYEAGKKVDRLREVIEASPVVTKEGVEIPVTISAGVSFGNNITSDPDVLKKQADIALYNSKDTGRNRVSFNDGNGNIRLFGEIGEEEWANFES